MSQRGLVRTRHGPTSRDWERHRPEMTAMYLEHRYTLDEVREHMQDKYSFNASPRQYQERFRQWKVRKNITNAVRQEMSSQQAHGRLFISPDEQRRLDRQLKAGRKLTSSSTPNSDSHLPVSTPSSTNVSHSGASLFGVGSVVESVNEEALTTDEGFSPDRPAVTVTRDDGTVQAWRTAFTLSNSPYSSSNHPNSSVVVVGHSLPRRLSISPSPPRMMTASDNAETIFFHVRQFCEYFTTIPVLPTADDEANSTMSNAVVQRSTNDLKDIIYLYKIGNFERANTFLQNYCDLPFEFVVDQSVDFLRQIINTLAPINTTRRPQVRRRLLDHLYRLTKDNLGPWHPFTVICRHLRLDQNSLETSMRALKVLQNSVMIWSRLMSFRTELDLVIMTRREHDYDNAMRKARLLVDTSTLIFGPESLPVRQAKLELSCIYIAQKDFDLGIVVCREICHNHQDTLAVRAMENLAEIHRLRSQPGPSLIWLEAAADLVVETEGTSVATTHILDKMFETLTNAGGPDMEQKMLLYNEKYRQYL